MFSKLSLASLLFGIALSNDCSEIITVTDVDFRQSVDCDFFGFPCDSLEGDYYFTGFDSSGRPRYTQPSTGAYFGVYVETFNNQFASLDFTFGNYYFAPTWDHFADVTFVDISCNDGSTQTTFEVEYGALTGGTNIQYYPQTPETAFPPLYITATLNDCDNIGFDNGAAPTPQPSPQPTDATPAPIDGNNNGCPNYDNTVYSSCSDDAFCSNCQPWGCGGCAQGYYRMGNLKRCQSCTANYPNCQSCNDWNGCTQCNPGYNLAYSTICNDEICEPQ